MSGALRAADHAARRDRLRGRLAEAGVDVLLTTSPPNVRYLSGFSGSSGQVLVATRAEDDRLVTDARYEARGALEAADLPRAISRDPVQVALDAAGRARLGFEAAHLSWEAGQSLRERAAEAGADVVATSGLVEALRAVKDDAEVERLARACAITVDALGWLLDEVVVAGRTERELAVRLERRFVDLGADAAAFPPIVASGPNAAIPHHDPGPRRLGAGDVLVVDCGARVDGYHADCTRTVAVGHLDEDLAGVHEIVVAAQAAARGAVVAGAVAGDVDRAAREVVEAAGHGERFVHGTGHGVGLEVHEAPAVRPGSAATLEAGTVLTVEPGVYLPGTGGVRIEDTVLVTDRGPRLLTDAPRGLRVI